MICCLKVRSEIFNWFLATRITRLFTEGRKPFNRFWLIEMAMTALVVGLKSLLGAFCHYPNVLLIERVAVVPVRNPCCTPYTHPFCVVTRALVPAEKALVRGVVWCENEVWV